MVILRASNRNAQIEAALYAFIEVAEHILLNNGNHIRAGGNGYGDLQDCINGARAVLNASISRQLGTYSYTSINEEYENL